ncbi:protein argonaute-2-like [Erinaceus europaeus]|uniref:Protein argonaute-2-like n=1 Tax=Erinaceus europaeus TaxID=9365 RepID=A0ABM3WSN5_ERIEU|nr:protein argonaute-2-like [Erinaceus europaeus]
MDIPKINIYHYEVDIKPEKCSKRVNREIVEYMFQHFKTQVFGAWKPLFDGRRNLYTAVPLPIGRARMELEVKLPGAGRDRFFKVMVQWVSCVTLETSRESLPGWLPFVHLEKTQAQAVANRHLPAIGYTPASRSDRWFDFHRFIWPFEQTMFGIEVSTPTFCKAWPVIEFGSEVLDLESMEEQQRPLTDSQSVRLTEETEGLDVEITYYRQLKSKYPVCDVSRWPVSHQTFLKGEQPVECTVAQHSKDSHKLILHYPHLPSLHIAPKLKHTNFSLELCDLEAAQWWLKMLMDYQPSATVGLIARSAPGGRAETRRQKCSAGLSTDSHAFEFGIVFKDELTEVTGSGLQPPSASAWGVLNAWNKQFRMGLEVKMWALACFVSQNQCTEAHLKAFIKQLKKMAREACMPIQGLPCFCKYVTGVATVEPLLRHLKTTHVGLQLLLVILPSKNHIFSEVRRLGASEVGLVTQCVQMTVVQRPTPMGLFEICLKINTRLGEVTNSLLPLERPLLFQQPVLFVGADVTHSASRHGRKPSVAAIVGSLDSHFNRYCALTRIQQHGGEILQDLVAMVRHLLLQFYKSTRFKPTCIFFYRLGAFEGQFQQLLHQELLAIRKACGHLEKNYQPAVTFILVQKHRHGHRSCHSLRTEQVGATGGEEAPQLEELDFSLGGPAGAQGSSSLAHYRVLWDDSGFSAAQLQGITHHLCHTYLHCTRPVAVPAPAYYAHLVALRVKYHLLD